MIPVVVFAKVPFPGIAKTRIAATAGQETADRVYRELLNQTSHTVKEIPHYVAYTGHNDPQILKDIFPGARSFFAQSEGTLGDRMRSACLHLLTPGTPGVIVIGCDCPCLDKSDIWQAIGFLETVANVVIGPALDGGYYLIGCTPASLAVFDAQNWSMPTLFDETMGIIRKRGFHVQALRTLSDIDTMEDYNRWQSESGEL